MGRRKELLSGPTKLNLRGSDKLYGGSGGGGSGSSGSGGPVGDGLLDQLQDIQNASQDIRHADAGPAASPSEHGSIPEWLPSPRSFWVDLHPIEDFIGHDSDSLSTNSSRKATGSIPEEPPIPLSYWIDLHPLEYADRDSIPTAPEPKSLFLQLKPVDDSGPEMRPEMS
ncbi:hypothetical protein HWV62_11253 [Athelia sp. TMB]|nr:hypothetical protein HWV62_11253 [Athelia sp. TMB]